MKKNLNGTIFLAIVACFLWSTAFAGIKIGLEYITPLRFAGFRFIFASLLILPFAGKFSVFLYHLKTNWRKVLLLGFFQTYLLYTLFYFGIDRSQAAVTAIIVGSQPVFIAVMSHFAMGNDRITLHKVLSLMLGVLGVVIISWDQLREGSGGGSDLLGLTLLFISNIASGAGNILVARDQSRMPSMMLTSAQLMAGGIGLFLTSLIFEPAGFEIKPLRFYAAMAWLSFISAAAFSIWFSLLKRPGVKVSILNVWKFIIPVFGAAWAWWLLPGEDASIYQIIGMVVIGISIISMFYKNSKLEVFMKQIFSNPLHR